MRIQLSNDSVQVVTSDLLAIGYFEGDTTTAPFIACDVLMDGALSGLVRSGDLSGRLNQTLVLYPPARLSAQRIVLIGLGKASELTLDKLRTVAGSIVRTAEQVKANDVAVAWLGADLQGFTLHDIAHTLAEGATLAAYHFEGYGTVNRDDVHPVQSFSLLVPELSDEIALGIAHGEAYAGAANWAREVVNMPGNKLTPTVLAQKAIEMAERHGFAYEVLDKPQMETLGMGGLLAVNQGSQQPPKMIVLTYRGCPESKEVLGIVGKGITFDAGGISIKPSANLDLMKTDMGGGAAALGAMEAIGRLKPRVNVIAVVPATENLPSGSAFKPGDVIHTMSGKTIEVLDTDAEGRIVLADGVAYAKHLGATRIVDLATLTGAIIVALGKITSGVMTNDEAFLTRFQAAAKRAGEKVWPMPTFDEYKETIKSRIADVKNLGSDGGGSITAALFVAEFVGDTPWLHVDMAGTAWTDKASSLYEKGGTGVMVRTLAALVESMAE